MDPLHKLIAQQRHVGLKALELFGPGYFMKALLTQSRNLLLLIKEKTRRNKTFTAVNQRLLPPKANSAV